MCGKKFGWSRVRWPFFKQNLKVYFYGVGYSVSMFECSEISVSEREGEGAYRTFVSNLNQIFAILGELSN